MDDILAFSGLVKQFGGNRAVDAASFTVRRGSITGLIGPNGAGKTTCFNCIAGFLRPDAGRVELNGESISGMISLEMLGYRTREPGSQTYPPYVDATQYPDTGDFIAVVGNEPSQSLALGLTKALKQTTPELRVESLVLPGRADDFVEVRLSDHCSFWEQDFKAAMLTDTAFFRNPHYHQATDTLDTLDIDFIRDICVGVTAYLQDPVT